LLAALGYEIIVYTDSDVWGHVLCGVGFFLTLKIHIKLGDSR
jgi:hypothetical protein